MINERRLRIASGATGLIQADVTYPSNLLNNIKFSIFVYLRDKSYILMIDFVVPTAMKAPQIFIVIGSPSDSENLISCFTVPFKK